MSIFSSQHDWVIVEDKSAQQAHLYIECNKTGDRQVLRGGYQPIDRDWLQGAPSGRYYVDNKLVYPNAAPSLPADNPRPPSGKSSANKRYFRSQVI